MNLLQLTQALWRESGTGGRIPVSVVDQNGEALRLVEWIRRADVEIQLQHTDWGFRWSSATFPTVVDQSLYSPEPDLAEYDELSFKLDGQPLDVHQYLDVRDEYRDPTSGGVHRAILMPDGTIRLDQTPSTIQQVTYDYFIDPIEMLVDNTSESIIPEPYRMAIVGRALMLYANYEPAPELMPQAQLLYSSFMQPLEAAWLPGKRDAHRQAEGNMLEISVE